MITSSFRFRLDSGSGVPVYRQLIDQVQAGIATGTFIASPTGQVNDDDRARRLDQLIDEFVARAGAGGFTLSEVLDALKERGR